MGMFLGPGAALVLRDRAPAPYTVWPPALSELSLLVCERVRMRRTYCHSVCEACVTTGGILKCRMVGRVEGRAPQHPV